MNSTRIRYFLTVNETSSIRKAAQLLHISPAALSKAIKQLEQELNIKLLIAHGRGILITQEGREFARKAAPLLEGFLQLKKEIKQKKNDKCSFKKISIGSFEVFTTHFLSKLITPLSENIQLYLYEFMPGELEKNLLAETIDYGITYLPIATAGIQHHLIAEVEMGVFGRKNNFTHCSFAQLPFVIPIQPLHNTPTKVQGLDGWPDDEIERLVKYRVTAMESALALCRFGKAVAYLPSFVIDLHNQTVKSKYQLELIYYPKNYNFKKQAVYLVQRKNSPADEFFKKIVAACGEI